MSIYVVYLPSWYPKKPKRFEGQPEEAFLANLSENKRLHEFAKSTVELSSCYTCGGLCTWKKSWGHHSIPFGHGDVFCSKKCYLNEETK